MKKLGLFVLLSLLSNAVVQGLLLTRPFDHDIYSGRHFNELVFDEDGITKRSAVLAMYKPQCDSKLQEYKLTENLPADFYLIFLKYDYESTPKYSWYHFDDMDDLYKRYAPKTCMELLYFPVGTPVDKPIRSHAHSGVKVSEAVWKLVKVSFSIRNLYGSDLVVRLEVKKKVVSTVTLAPTHEEEATAYVTHNLFVKDAQTGKLIYATVIDLSMDGEELVIDRYIAMDIKEEEWRRTARKELESENEKVLHTVHSTAQKYLLDMKQPAVLPTFTDDGYVIEKVPVFLMKELNKYYQKERTSSLDAKFDVKGIELTEEIAKKCDLVVKIMVEEWSDSQLQLTKAYPILEYRNRSLVTSHLGNLQSHVFAVLMVIDKDLGNASDWIFDIVGHDGVRKNLTLEVGEMLIYEAATCLLGNPFPFEGNRFVTATIFYRPDGKWQWRLSKDNKSILHGKEVKESVSVFATSNMLSRSKLKLTKDEL